VVNEAHIPQTIDVRS